jgi:hypothetical protein
MQQMHSVTFFRLRAFIFSCYIDGASFAIVPVVLVILMKLSVYSKRARTAFSQLSGRKAMVARAQAARELENCRRKGVRAFQLHTSFRILKNH